MLAQHERKFQVNLRVVGCKVHVPFDSFHAVLRFFYSLINFMFGGNFPQEIATALFVAIINTDIK